MWSMASAPIIHSSACGHLVINMASRVRSSWLVVSTICLLVLCDGCSVRRIVFNDIITSEQVDFIRVGETTIRAMVDHIGAPDEIAESESGTVALYNWSDTKSAAMDFGAVPRLFSPYAPTMTLSKTGFTPEQFQVVFDPQWTVRAYGFSRRSTDEPALWFWPF